ncbi:MAG: hypothetical protein ACXABY_00335 [Candidatus Thorarchaeota archaeon]|jgi:hypothetical protein
MAREHIYRIWCTTDSKWVHTDWINAVTGEPDECPEDSEHSIGTVGISDSRLVTYFEDTVNPTTSENTAAGYERNDEWQNTMSQELFVLVDADNGIWMRSAGMSSIPLLGRMCPTVDGIIDVLGWNIKTNEAASLTSASPVTMSEPAFHSHVIVDVSGASGLPFTIRVTGTSVNESTGALTESDTEDLDITANGYSQTAKSWIDPVEVSIVEASKSCTADVYRNTYWDRGNTDFTLIGCRFEWIPDADTWSITIKLIHVNEDGSLSYVDNKTFSNSDSPPRAANGKPGKYKRGDYAYFMHGADNEGLIVVVDQTNISSVFLEVKYSA